MQNSARVFLLVILSVMTLAACGQKGPLFLPGDPSTVTSVTQPGQQAVDEEEDDEDDNPR